MSARVGAPAVDPGDTRRRAIVEGVEPCVDGGQFAVKRVVGEELVVEADCFTDGHDALRCVLQYRRESDPAWSEVEMRPLGNDRWRAAFRVDSAGDWRYAVLAWVDPFLSWQGELARRRDPADLRVALAVGEALLERLAAGSRDAGEAGALRKAAARFRERPDDPATVEIALSAELRSAAARASDRSHATRSPVDYRLQVDARRAGFSAWYECFPRSFGRDGRHGTLADCRRMVDYAAGLGFDVLYLPPIHPIGDTKRKGPNNALVAGPDDPGSPWAIGAATGGHKAVHPGLGTVGDLRDLVAYARTKGVEIALDIAFQCAPDHPYAKEHPEWFRHRPDGSIQYAENPPKKYQDIYPFDFETEAWRALRDELTSIVQFWVDQGVTVFRVDNPHTKPFPLWEHLIREIRARQPEVVFLAEAFTRPRVMQRLAKLGYSQSYTYFAWRNTKWELESYFRELTRPPLSEYFRPNVWPNTPDILTEYLQHGGRPAFTARLVLAATLSSTYGVYGPAFELCEAAPREPGSEEYLDSEKYQLRRWDLDRADSLAPLMGHLNAIRRENPALHDNRSLRFHAVDNEALIAYSKSSADGANLLVMVVNLDPHHRQSGWLDLPLEELGIDPTRPFLAEDLLTRASYHWTGPRNYVELSPEGAMAHVFRIRRRLKSERDFDYYM